MKQSWILGMLFVVTSAAAVPPKNTDALLGQAEETSWGVWNEGILKTLIATNEDARSLIAAVFEDDTALAEVADFSFIDLKGDGVLEMIASVDVSGRAFFNNIDILWKRNKQINVEEIPAYNVTNISEIAKDLDGDGQMELIIPTAIEIYNGTEPIAIIPKIYTLQGAGYTESSKRFKKHYQDIVIPKLQQRLEIAKQSQNSGEVGVLQRELTAIQRLLND